LADNERATQFYVKLGGRNVRQATERFDSETRVRVAFAFD
jgi:hypothetical protein